MKKLHSLKIIIFVFILFSFLILTIFNSSKNNSFLVSENRYKTSLPKFTYKNVMEGGKFFKEFENFFNDRFKFRNALLKSKIYLDMNIAKRYKIGEVVLSENRDRLFNFYNYKKIKFNQKRLGKGLEKWKKIKEYLDSKNIPLVVINMPDTSQMYVDKYPSFLNNEKEYYDLQRNNFIKGLKELNIDFIDGQDILYQDRDKYYTKTDHHPNFNATLKIYDELIKNINKKYFKIDNLLNDINIKKSNHKFIGSYNRKLFGLFNSNEEIIYAEPKNSIKFEKYENEKLVKSSYIDLSVPYYRAYMYGDKANTVIKTSREELPNILIVGDSTTNALETVMWMNANNMSSLDFRHFKNEGGIIEYIEKNPQDIVIVSILSRNADDLEPIMK